MTNRRTFIILAGLAVLVAAFLLLYFRAAVSNTQAETNSVTISSGDQLPDALQQREKITLIVTGEGPLVKPLQEALAAQIRKAGLGDVELSDEVDADYPNPALIVEIGRPGVFWTPFYGSGSFPVSAWFASNGDTTIRNDETVGFDNTEGPGMIMEADYKVSDRTYGIMSRPGYYQGLANWLANSIVETVRKLYEPKL